MADNRSGSRICRAATEAEKKKIYEMRYQIYVEEMKKDFPNADHENKMLYDQADDDANNVLFYMEKHDQIAATVRVQIGTSEQYPCHFRQGCLLDDFQQFQPGAPILAMASRLFISPSYRKTKVFFQMILAVVQEIVEKEIPFLFVMSNPEIVNLYRGVGAKTFTQEGFWDEGVGYLIPMVFMPGDIQHMKTIGSVMYPYLSRMKPDGRAARWLEDWRSDCSRI